MEHHLQLAVMSACQTAAGKQHKGEGVVSLARAFFQSGCPSIIASLWNVSDQKAGVLMMDFHEHLQQGENKSAALAAAKRDYLENATTRNTHPFYWAGFIQMGDAAPLSTGGFPIWWVWVLSGLGLVVLAGLFFLKKK